VTQIAGIIPILRPKLWTEDAYAVSSHTALHVMMRETRMPCCGSAHRAMPVHNNVADLKLITLQCLSK